MPEVEVGRSEGLRGTRTYDSLILTGDTVGEVTLEETENHDLADPEDRRDFLQL